MQQTFSICHCNSLKFIKKYTLQFLFFFVFFSHLYFLFFSFFFLRVCVCFSLSLFYFCVYTYLFFHLQFFFFLLSDLTDQNSSIVSIGSVLKKLCLVVRAQSNVTHYHLPIVLNEHTQFLLVYLQILMTPVK